MIHPCVPTFRGRSSKRPMRMSWRQRAFHNLIVIRFAVVHSLS